MKNSILFFASVAALVSVGCNKIGPDAGIETRSGCELNLQLTDNSLTKVTGTTGTDESMIRNVQIFVFRAGADDKSSVLDACLSKGFDAELSGSASYNDLSLKCTVGARHVFAIVNADIDYTADESVGTLSDLLSKTMSLSKMRADKLLMIGENRNVSLSSGTQSQTVEVHRTCASVILESVKNDMQASVYRKDGRFKIKNVYLVNVPAEVNLGRTLAASSLSAQSWYARGTAETDAEKNKLIYDAQTETVVNYGTKNESVHTFYTFPNDCAAITDAAWSPRATRLVVEALYNDGKEWHSCYYPITLYKAAPGLEANKQYRVNLIVNRPGSDSPDKPVEFGDISGTISVVDWVAGESYTETI